MKKKLGRQLSSLEFQEKRYLLSQRCVLFRRHVLSPVYIGGGGGGGGGGVV